MAKLMPMGNEPMKEDKKEKMRTEIQSMLKNMTDDQYTLAYDELANKMTLADKRSAVDNYFDSWSDTDKQIKEKLNTLKTLASGMNTEQTEMPEMENEQMTEEMAGQPEEMPDYSNLPTSKLDEMIKKGKLK
jgi:gas vesicle protein